MGDFTLKTIVKRSGKTSGSPLVFTVQPDDSGRLDLWLVAQMPGVSRSRLHSLIKDGSVSIDGSPVRSSSRVAPGQVVEVRLPPPAPTAPSPEEIPLEIMHEDNDLIVLVKPAGMVVHPAPGHTAGTLVNALLHHCDSLEGVGAVERPGIVHRLDRDTSGVMVVAKNHPAMEGLVRLFKCGEVLKEYLALVHGRAQPLSGVVENLIGRHPVDRKRMAVVRRNGKLAITRYRVEKLLGYGVSLVRCEIQTGRTHQIRVHMHSLGCPIVGDSVYGRKHLDKRLPQKPARHMLHAVKLAFKHPVSLAPLNFYAPVPDDFTVMQQSLAEP